MALDKLHRTAIIYLLCGFFLFLVFAGIQYFFTHGSHAHEESSFTICPVKNATGYPCPGCGTVRSLILLSRGHLVDSILMNPAGLLIVLVSLTVALLVVIDIAARKSYYPALLDIINRAQARRILIPLFVILTLLNWYWNISKGL